MLTVNFADKVNISCSPDTIFTEYSFGIEQGINWFFGRGVSAFEVQRFKEGSHQCVDLTPLKPLKPMTFSLVTSVGVLVKEGFWPKEIPFQDIWRLPDGRKEVKDGRHRVFRYNENMSIIQNYGLNPSTSIGEISYGLSDLITGLFWLGATNFKFQGSLGLMQHQINKGFESEELAKYLADPGEGYAINQKVSTLE